MNDLAIGIIGTSEPELIDKYLLIPELPTLEIQIDWPKDQPPPEQALNQILQSAYLTPQEEAVAVAELNW